MNPLFVTQGLGLRFHLELARALEAGGGLGRRGFFVADSLFYGEYAPAQPELRDPALPILKEWEIVGEARRRTPDPSRIADLDRRFGAGAVWDAIICDRRMFLGPRCKQRQDYRSRFTHDQLLSIVQTFVERAEEFIDSVRPDVLFSFVPVTFGEYLLALLARERDIPTLFLTTTKIENYVTWTSDFFGCPPHTRRLYHEYRSGAQAARRGEAAAYLEAARVHAGEHEGMIPIPGKKAPRSQPRNPLTGAARLLKSEIRYRTADDNHLDGVLVPFLYKSVISPAKSRGQRRALARHFVRPAQLDGRRFAYYPLHSEPETTLLVHGKAFQNQIELVRNLARSLPADMLLVVKEHPRAIGYRSLKYYHKLLRIPNVRLANPYTDSMEFVRRCDIVLNVASWVGFEAVISEKPVIMLSRRGISVLPDTMVRDVTDLTRLAEQVASLLVEFRYDARAVEDFVAACMHGAERLDFFTVFLAKRGRYTTGTARTAPAEQMRRFAEYTRRRVAEVSAPRAPESLERFAAASMEQ